MSWWCYKFDGIQSVGSDVGGIGVCYADTEADIGTRTDFSGKVLLGGSTCHAIAEGTDWMIDSSGVWNKQPDPHTTQLDLSDYYTDTETDAAISTALASYTDTAGMTAAIAAANYFLRGQQITSSAETPFDVFSLTSAGAWYYGASAATSMLNLPQSAPTTAGGQIRIKENQGTNRLLMELTVNSVPLSGVVFRCWYTASGGGSWGSWYKFEGVVDS